MVRVFQVELKMLYHVPWNHYRLISILKVVALVSFKKRKNKGYKK